MFSMTSLDIEDIYLSDSSLDLDILLHEVRPRAMSAENFGDVMVRVGQRLRRFQAVPLVPRVRRDGIYGYIPPPTFGGNQDEDAKLFFSQFWRYVHSVGVLETQWAETLGCLVFGKALEVYDELVGGITACGCVCTFEELKQGILARFIEKKSDIVIWRLLCARELRADEDIREYYAVLRKLNSELASPLPDLLNPFLNGLPATLRQHVLFQHPLDVSHAVKLAAEYVRITSDDFAVRMRTDAPPFSENKRAFEEGETLKVALSAAICSGGGMSVNVRIGNKNLQALIDTGSEISVIQSDTLKKALGVRNLEGSPYDKVISVGGGASPVLGLKTVEISFGKFCVPAQLHVLGESPFQVVLGRDFLQKYVTHIDIFRNELVLNTSNHVGEPMRLKLNTGTKGEAIVPMDCSTPLAVRGKLSDVLCGTAVTARMNVERLKPSDSGVSGFSRAQRRENTPVFGHKGDAYTGRLLKTEVVTQTKTKTKTTAKTNNGVFVGTAGVPEQSDNPHGFRQEVIQGILVCPTPVKGKSSTQAYLWPDCPRIKEGLFRVGPAKGFGETYGLNLVPAQVTLVTGRYIKVTVVNKGENSITLPVNCVVATFQGVPEGVEDFSGTLHVNKSETTAGICMGHTEHKQAGSSGKSTVGSKAISKEVGTLLGTSSGDEKVLHRKKVFQEIVRYFQDMDGGNVVARDTGDNAVRECADVHTCTPIINQTDNFSEGSTFIQNVTRPHLGDCDAKLRHRQRVLLEVQEFFGPSPTQKLELSFDKLSEDYADILCQQQNYIEEIRNLRLRNEEVLKHNNALEKQLHWDIQRRATARKKLGAIELTLAELGRSGA